MKKLRIVFFAAVFPPTGNPEAISNGKLALALLSRGHQLTVVSRMLVGQLKYDYGSQWSEPWLPLAECTHHLQSFAGNRLARIVTFLKSSANCRHPIAGCIWAAEAVKLALRTCSSTGCDIVVSRAFPESSHLAAMSFAKRSGSPWIANWNDPWEFMRRRDYVNSLIKNIGFRRAVACRAFGARASYNTFPSKLLRDKMCRILGTDADSRSCVIPHCGFTRIRRSEAVSGRPSFELVYTGRLSIDQDPAPFLRGLEVFLRNNKGAKVRVRFIGIDETDVMARAKSIGVDQFVTFGPPVGYLESLRKIQESDAALIIDPQECEGMLLTSKFVDYAQVGTPILALTNPGSTVWRYLDEFGGGKAVDGCDLQSIAEAIGGFYRSWRSGNLAKVSSGRLEREFHPDTTVNAFEELCERVMRRQGDCGR